MSARKYAIAVILIVAIGAPIVELFDWWDPPIEAGGGDTEANAVVVALCVGVAFAMTDLVAGCLRVSPASSAHSSIAISNARPVMWVPLRIFAPTGRAPTPLRV